MRASLGIFVTALAFVGTTSPLAAQAWPDPIIKVEGLRQISPRIHTVSYTHLTLPTIYSV